MNLKTYLDEHYGQCSHKPCKCIRTGWIGTSCEHWEPTKATTWNELAYWQLKLGQRRAG